MGGGVSSSSSDGALHLDVGGVMGVLLFRFGLGGGTGEPFDVGVGL